MQKKYIKLVLILFTGILFSQCRQSYTPRPKGYFRIDFPKKNYTLFKGAAPFTFEYPVYGKVVKDTAPGAEPYWMNVEFPAFQAKIHLSYKPIHKNLDGFIDDAHTLAYKHTIKADAIDESYITKNDSRVYGLFYEIKGNAASSIQFYVTDSIHHFLRGALYFNSIPNKDSLAPSIKFFRQDILHMIETLKWKEQ